MPPLANKRTYPGVVGTIKRMRLMKEDARDYRAGSTDRIARSALALARRNASLFEKKHLDSVIGGTGITSSPTKYHLTAIAQGDSDEERIGLQVQLSGLKLNWTARPSSSATSASYLRVMVISLKTPGTSLTNAELFEDTTAGRMHYSIQEWVHRYAHKVHYDKCVDTSAGGASANSGVTRSVWIPIPAGCQKVRYDNSGNPEKNSLHLLLVSNQATNGPQVEFNRRLYFKDA